MTVSRATIAGLVAARLETIGNASHYVAEIPQTPPTVSRTDLRVLPYDVLWFGAGAPGEEQALAGGVQVDTVLRWTITAASGDHDWTLKLVDLIDGLFSGWEPTIGGLTVGTCIQDFDPGPIVPGSGFSPTRFYLQLPYRLQVGS